MYCIKCGKKLEGNESFCTNCGEKLSYNINSSNNNDTESNKSASIVLGIISIVAASLLIFAPISFILGLVGLIFAIKSNKKIKNTAGIVLNSIGLVLSFAISVIFIMLMCIFMNVIKDDWDNTDFYNDEYHEYYEDIKQNRF